MKIHCRILQIVAALGLWLTISAEPSTNFGIYLTVEPMDVTSPGSPPTTDVSRIALQGTPIITGSDVDYYNRTNGVIMVKEETLRRIRALFEDRDAGTQQPSYRPPMAGRTFVVVAGGERIFLGALWSLFSSYGGPSVPALPIDAPSLIRARYSSPSWSDPRIAASLRHLKRREP